FLPRFAEVRALALPLDLAFFPAPLRPRPADFDLLASFARLPALFAFLRGAALRCGRAGSGSASSGSPPPCPSIGPGIGPPASAAVSSSCSPTPGVENCGSPLPPTSPFPSPPFLRSSFISRASVAVHVRARGGPMSGAQYTVPSQDYYGARRSEPTGQTPYLPRAGKRSSSSSIVRGQSSWRRRASDRSDRSFPAVW